MTFKEKIENVLHDAIHGNFSSKEIIKSIVRLSDNQAIRFANWLEYEETLILISDLKIVGELPKNPTKRELFSVYKKQNKK